ncbi:MAG: twin-arginine translocation signal domain-containing protein [Nitrospirae bacterium]|nr:MAG: twin-arginine translocation signal domain-containing protein [Nitrospirota bacterium]
MERRTFLKTAALGAAALGTAQELFAAEKYFPSKADQGLFEAINKAKDPAKKTPLEKKHAPAITAPEKVQAGQPFTVEVSVGEVVHDMGPAHWIEYIELNIGNEPAGRVDFQAKGYLSPKATFTVVLTKDAAPSGKITLIARERCNLHGYWESSIDLTVA